VPTAAAIACGGSERVIAICSPDSAGPMPSPSAAMNSSDCQSGVDASNVAKPSAPSAASA
jgi:hypothetical protein